jgi:hypothetical protein
VYDSELNGQDVTFGTSGFLYQNNKLMYDRTTKSLWHSLTGEPVVGSLAHSGIELERYPVTVTSWGEWIDQHPESTVVDIETGYNRRYLDPSEIGSAYFEYRASPEAMFPTFKIDDRLPEKSNVVGIAVDGQALALPLEIVLRELAINTSVGGQAVTILGHQSTGVLGVFESDGTVFTVGDDFPEIVDDTGEQWVIDDDGLRASDGRSLSRVPMHELFWFAWAAFFPGTQVYQAG